MSQMWETEFTDGVEEIYFELTENRYIKVFRVTENEFRIRIPTQVHYEELKITNLNPEEFATISQGPEPYNSIFHTFKHYSGPRYAIFTEDKIHLYLRSFSPNISQFQQGECYDFYNFQTPSMSDFNQPLPWVANVPTQEFGSIELTAVPKLIIFRGPTGIGSFLDLRRYTGVLKTESLDVWEQGSMRVDNCSTIEPMNHFNEMLGQVYQFNFEIIQSSNNQKLYSGSKVVEVASVIPKTNGSFDVIFNESVEAVIYESGQPTNETYTTNFSTRIKFENLGHRSGWRMITESTNVMFGTNVKGLVQYNPDTQSFNNKENFWYGGVCGNGVPAENLSTFSINVSSGLASYYHQIHTCYVAPGFRTNFTRAN